MPQQALALQNSPFVWDQARLIARRLGLAARPGAFVTAAFEHILGRAPRAAERETCRRFLASQERLLADPSRLTAFPPGPRPPAVPPAADARGQAREHFIHALLEHNDFITVR